jgi:hypothetical protein
MIRPDDAIGRVIIISLELLALAYLTNVAWLTSGWFVDDALASRLQNSDWWLIGLRRFTLWFAVGIAFSAAVSFANVYILRWPRRLAFAGGLLAGAIVVTSSFTSSAIFIAKRPWF